MLASPILPFFVSRSDGCKCASETEGPLNRAQDAHRSPSGSREFWIVGGGSGHGFKHGPAVGEYVTRLMTTNMTPEARFALHRKATVTRRAVY